MTTLDTIQINPVKDFSIEFNPDYEVNLKIECTFSH